MNSDITKLYMRKNSKFPISILIIFGTFVLVVVRLSDSENLITAWVPVAPAPQESLIRSIPAHPPFRYNMMTTKVTYPWKDDKECSRFAVCLGEALPFIYLISFPRSGNTWLRYLLEGATGFFTGSVYSDEMVFKLGYLGETENPFAGTTLFIKEHLFTMRFQLRGNKYPAVLLIRNPKNAIESRASFSAGKGNFSYMGSKKDFQKLDTNFDGYLTHWERLPTLLLEVSLYLHVVVYENLKADPMEEIRKIMQFMRMPEDPERLACLAKYTEGPVNRGQPEFEPFSAEQTAAMADAVERVNALMLVRGFPPLPFAQQRITTDNKH